MLPALCCQAGPVRPVPSQATQQLGVFTARQAYQSGWSERQLEHAAATGALLRLRRGAYAALEFGSGS